MGTSLVNPSTGTQIDYISFISNDVLKTKLKANKKAYISWKKWHLNDRIKLFKTFAALLNEQKEEWAALMAKLMGKPIAEGLIELDKCIRTIHWYCNETPALLNPKEIIQPQYKAKMVHEPLGPILLLMPWNFPVWQVLRAAIPNLLVGNTVLLKHADNVIVFGDLLESLFLKAGFPESVFTHLPIGISSLNDVIAAEEVVGVTLTGSENAGIAVASKSGQMLKKTVLELGGSDPFIVFEDADLQQAAIVAAKSRLINNGQSCVAAKRFIVQKTVFEEFLAYFKTEVEKYRIGDPLSPNTQLGPLAKATSLTTLEAQISKSIQMGAQLIYGGHKIGDKGYYFEPTILTAIKSDMPVWKEEVFGPVASFMSFETVAEAITLANDTTFGLGASLWTKNIDFAFNITNEIEAGNVFINNMVKSDAPIPFGGIKKSGYGRELSAEGLFSFTNLKTISLPV